VATAFVPKVDPHRDSCCPSVRPPATGDHSQLLPGFHFELGDSSVQVGVRLLKRLDIRLRYQVLARVRHTEPQSFGRPVQASGEFRESSISLHSIHR
jgi:hypothetical protein